MGEEMFLAKFWGVESDDGGGGGHESPQHVLSDRSMLDIVLSVLHGLPCLLLPRNLGR